MSYLASSAFPCMPRKINISCSITIRSRNLYRRKNHTNVPIEQAFHRYFGLICFVSESEQYLFQDTAFVSEKTLQKARTRKKILKCIGCRILLYKTEFQNRFLCLHRFAPEPVFRSFSSFFFLRFKLLESHK